jgi:Domain of unknown function (DUF4168)
MRLLGIRPVAAAAFMAAAQLCIPAANAQNASPPSALPEQSTPAPQLSDQKLDAAAAALGQVASLLHDYQQRLQQAADQSEKQRIADEGNSALKKAVEDQGLSVEEYNSIIVVAQNDPEVRQKILQRMHPPGEEKQ